ncbi:MAG: hypothetical protein LC753_17090 [Acidobacteria bacterium]|nr:hypothetical protein [Acidobacteriota bacterium]MCA1651901.1 hypothetical protein [Acidobacteriota bacterium]
MEPAQRQREEYAVMRATIRERGTARIVLVPLIFIGWAGTAVATAAIITVAISTLVPLLVLAAGFEAVFALHLNVERIGRYLQAFHETDGGWEHIAMRYGERFPGTSPDPLFARLFVMAASVNFIPAALGGEPWEVGIVGALHLLFINRIRMARAFAATQRSADLGRFVELRSGGSGGDGRHGIKHGDTG